MKVVYIAGPFRAAHSWDVEQNIRRAEAAALDVWRMGAAAICPHANTRFYAGAAPDSLWLRGDLAILSRCDAMLLVGDWIMSEGCRGEVAHAERQNIPIFRDHDALFNWLSESQA